MGLAASRVTTGKVGAEIIEPVPVTCAPSEFGNDAQCERIAANAGEVLTEQIGGPMTLPAAAVRTTSM